VWRKTLEEYEPPAMDDGLKDELKAYVDRRRIELGD
jgi:trimethylamine--corrinoid protein Co-methyltransferase